MKAVVTVDFTEELAIIKGDDFTHTFEFQDEQCNPLDQSASSFTSNLTKNGVVLATFTVTVSTNNVILSLTDTETSALSETTKAQYRLRKTTGSVTTTIIGGDVEIRA